MVHRNDDTARDAQFVIRPNRSFTWRQSWIAFGIVSATCLGVAAYWTAHGFWPVLPFAGLEVVVLGACMYRVSATGRETEVVSVGEATVAVEKGRHRPVERWEFPRAWATVALQGARHRWYPSRLVIRSHGREVGIGDFLNEEERVQLAGDLRRAIGSG